MIDDDAIVYVLAAPQWLLTRSPRVRVTTGCAVRAVDTGNTHASVMLASGERRTAAHVIVANGLAVPDLVAGVPLEAKKGHLLISDRYPGTLHHQVLELG